MAQQATFDSNLEATMNPNMRPTLPMDQTYMAIANSMQSSMGDLNANMSANMNNLAQMPMQWHPELQPNLYDLQNLHDIMAQQPPYGPMGSPSETYTSETHEVRSLSSSDNGWNLVERVDPHAGAIFNPQQTLHPRSLSDSSSDNGQQSRSSLDGYVEVSHCASSPSNDSTGELNFNSDQELYYDMERQSPPVVVSNMAIQPICTDHLPSTSPQRSPVSPPGRSRPRKGTNTKTAASTKGISKKPLPNAKPEVTEKRVGRRKGPLRPDQRKQASEIRKLGACIRCRFLKKTVSGPPIPS